MKKLKIIFNLITLALTTGLLVMITLAWYAVNKQASVEAGTGMVAQQEKLVARVDYYKFSTVSNNTTYTVGGHIYITNGHIYNADGTQNDSASLSMNSYSYGAVAPTIYYIRIQLNANVAINQIRFISSATAFVGFGTDGTGGVINSNDNLSLSSVIRFAYLGCSGDNAYVNGDSATFSNVGNWNSFDYSSSGAITTSTKNVLGNTITSDGARYIHLLLDYDVSHLNEFYGNNLANQTILTANGGPKFTNTDFTIYLLS